MHAEAEFKFDCGRCGQRLSADASTVGAVTQCPSCSEPLTVPSPDWSHAERPPQHGADGTGGVHGADGASAEALQQYQHALATLQGQLEEALQQRAALEQQLASSAAEVQLITSQLEMARESIRDATRRSQSLDKERTELLASQEQYVTHLQSFEAAYADLTARYEALETSLQTTTAELETSRGETAAAQEKISGFNREVESLKKSLAKSKKNLESSKDGREFVRLKEETEAAVRDRDEAVQARTAADERIVALTTEVATLSEQLTTATANLQESERKVAKLSDVQLQKDNVVLRSILERQKGELEQRFRELKKYQRAQYGVRIAYSLAIIAVAALLAYGLQYLPLILR